MKLGGPKALRPKRAAHCVSSASVSRAARARLAAALERVRKTPEFEGRVAIAGPYRPGERVTITEYYRWIFENSVPGLPAAAAKEGEIASDVSPGSTRLQSGSTARSRRSRTEADACGAT